ncbi:uncharacterized protein MKZ38_002686 [Zalerion maritima]|uniref:Uncharacterized protein n=1 Tax=Zalerion maritima TaxID=339359 RepID=A0AAD5RPW2_9PEZI|nr:uncharacterized protein MKZ38_002686 [Zalerion maritima]
MDGQEKSWEIDLPQSITDCNQYPVAGGDNVAQGDSIQGWGNWCMVQDDSKQYMALLRSIRDDESDFAESNASPHQPPNIPDPSDDNCPIDGGHAADADDVFRADAGNPADGDYPADNGYSTEGYVAPSAENYTGAPGGEPQLDDRPASLWEGSSHISTSLEISNKSENHLLTKEDAQFPGMAPRKKGTSAKDKAFLEAKYLHNSNPDKQARLNIVEQVFMDEKQVKTWFQNRRKKAREAQSTKPCPHCGKTYSRAQNFKRHLATHSGPHYKCSCGTTFTRTDILKRHRARGHKPVVKIHMGSEAQA